MKIIAFINQKGGVGKSTLTLHTASYLKSLGKNVLIIDLDAQGNVTKACGVDTHNQATIREVLLSEVPTHKAIFGTKFGFLIPSDVTLGHSEKAIAGTMGCETLLKRTVNPFLNDAEKSGKAMDYVLIDCPPTFNVFTYNALTFATDVVLPCKAEEWSLQALKQFLVIKEQIQNSFDKKLHIAGVVINMYQSNIRTQQIYIERFKEMCAEIKMPLIKQTIRQSTDINTAIANSQTVFEYKPSSQSAKDLQIALEEVLNNIKEVENVFA